MKILTSVRIGESVPKTPSVKILLATTPANAIPVIKGISAQISTSAPLPVVAMQMQSAPILTGAICVLAAKVTTVMDELARSVSVTTDRVR